MTIEAFRRSGLAPGNEVVVRRDDGSLERRRIKYEPWKLGHGVWVIGLQGIAGGYDLDRVEVGR